ncbi:hypothetical protein DFQ29_007236 [Apophysomyces sp. BC1021]|nr:hypothetical protein DFQ29_007236 [Apophysomyces sp. BC1021]
MVPNSRIVPPPSPTHFPPSGEQPYRHRSLSATLLYSRPDVSSQQKSSKNFLSRFRSNPQTHQLKQQQQRQQQSQRGTPQPSSSYIYPPTPEQLEIVPTLSARAKLSSSSLPPVGQGSRVKRKPLNENGLAMPYPTNGRPARPSKSKARIGDDYMLQVSENCQTGSHMDAVTQNDAIIRKPSQRGSIKGFGRLLKKLGKPSEEEIFADDLPQVRPVSVSSDGAAIKRPHHSNSSIPLAPPAPSTDNAMRTSHVPPPLQLQPEIFLSSIPDEYISRPNTARRHRSVSETSTRHIDTTNRPYNRTKTLNAPYNTYRNAGFPVHSKYNRNINDTTTTTTMATMATRNRSVSSAPAVNDQEFSPSSRSMDRISNNPPRNEQYTGKNPSGTLNIDDNGKCPPSRLSNSSARKSSGSNSIYSTFGADSYRSSGEIVVDVERPSRAATSESMPDQSVKPPGVERISARSTENLINIVSNNVQQRKQSGRMLPAVSSIDTVTSASEPSESSSVTDTSSINSYNTVESTLDSETVTEDDNELQRALDKIDGTINAFRGDVGARETIDTDEEDEDAFVDATGSSQDDIEREKGESKLTKRLSGGHFGSAGGLMLSIAPPVPPLPKTKDRRSQPPPEEIARAMLNWKRQSSGTNTRINLASTVLKSTDENSDEKRESTITAIDLRLVDTGKDENEEKELSIPDKQALRDQAADALMGAHKSGNPGAAEAAEAASQHQRSKSMKYMSDMISKTFDEAWLGPSPDITQVRDPRTIEQPEAMKSDNANFKESEQPVWTEDEPKLDIKDPKEAAQRLWAEDETFVPKNSIAEWLGQGKSFNAEVLLSYMDYFYFAGMRLDAAFRKLCSKLYFKAEAQQIDRILEAFANRYWQCNSKSIFGSADVVYAVVYSLLLLNTDLHVAQGNHNRMTRIEFVRNTMSAIYDQQQQPDSPEVPGHSQFSKAWEIDIESYLKILQPLSRRPSNNNRQPLDKRGSILGGRRVIGLKRSVNSIIRKSGRESMLAPDDIQPRKSTSSGPRPSSPPARSPRRESFSSVGSATSFGSLVRSGTLSPTLHQPMISFMNTHSSALFTSRPPYLKEGVVMRKHLLENATQKARHRDWKECFLVVGEGELKMYALQNTNESDRKSMFRPSSASFANLADSLSKTTPAQSTSFGGVPVNGNKWASSSQLIGTIKLNHTLSNVLPPPGYNRQRPHVLAIQQPHGGVYLFQAASSDQVNEWVATCNYWAARESKEPLAGGVSNMEYGWGACLNDVILDLDAVENGDKIAGNYLHDPDSVTIYDWIPPAPPMVSSTSDEQEQYDGLQKHLDALNKEINEHRELKSKLLVKFPSRCHNYVKAITNWEAKSKYLLHDIIKYQNYCDVLEKSIQRRHEVEAEAAATASSILVEEAEDTQQETRLVFRESKVDLIKEIGEELHLVF